MSKKKKDWKKIVPRRILIFTVSVLGVFTFYQIFVGNPFFDEFHPAIVYLIITAIAALLLVKVIRDNNRQQD